MAEDPKSERLQPLPLDLAWPEIEAALKSNRNLVLVAEPGAGKTTRFPPRFLRSGLVEKGKKILMLEPRRLAARAAASRIGFEQGWKVGAEVGYQVRFENRTSALTQLQVLTEGLLARRLQSDSEIKDVGAVILDEFHERSQHTDLALGLLYELQALGRQDLRLIVMSATLDAEKVAKFLGDCPVIRVPGRIHPVAVTHGKKPLMLDTGPVFLDSVAEVAIAVLLGRVRREGDILVFLPGAREIRGVRGRIQSACDRAGFDCFELHGSLSLDEQDRAIRANPERPKIVLATNIAETSLTIDGVGTVIDSGLARVVRLDSAGFERLQVSRISLASATQRTGRAGRQGPGRSYRLWNKIDEASMPEFEQPEIMRTDLTEPFLTLLSQGVSDPGGFSWFEKPPESALESASRNLSDLGFRDPVNGGLTIEGREALKLPLVPRAARLMLEAVKAGVPGLGARLCAILSEKDIVSQAMQLKRAANIESDLLLRLHLLADPRAAATHADPNAIRNVLRVARALEDSAKFLHLGPSIFRNRSISEDELAERLILLAFPDRICRRRRAKEPAARMVGGRGVTLAPYSCVETSELFVAVASSEPPPHVSREARVDAQISIASQVERAWIEEFFARSLSKKIDIVFSEDQLSVQKTWATAFHDLPLDEPHLSRPSADEAFPILLQETRAHWTSHFATHAELEQVLARLKFLSETLSEENGASFDFEPSQASFLEEVCFNETRFAEILAKSLGEAFVRHLPKETSRLLGEAPDAITVPSGSRIRIHYPAERAPFLEVRIQEIFGMKSSPRIALGRVPLVFHLLGPNYRPVQVTADLESFWKTGYSEVRKELRARYPKHSWPEDPTTAAPEAKGRRRQ